MAVGSWALQGEEEEEDQVGAKYEHKCLEEFNIRKSHTYGVGIMDGHEICRTGLIFGNLAAEWTE